MGNSITDGLKSRLTQYLKHVIEDDVLFTNSNPLHYANNYIPILFSLKIILEFYSEIKVKTDRYYLF